jgi:predicted deacylase
LQFGARGDGTPWSIAVYSVHGSSDGPVTGVVAGVWGDKPMGVLAAHDVVHKLSMRDDLRGTVIVIPAANPGALEIGSRVGPDALLLNRRFPGSPIGFLTDQTAHHLNTFLAERCGAVLDLHSGTPTMGLHYTYDFGNLAVSAAFGTLPVIPDRSHPTQLSAVMAARGIPSCLAEFGGGHDTAIDGGVTGTLNFLRARGHLMEPLQAPAALPLMRNIQLVLASTNGIWEHRRDASVSESISAGAFGHVRCAQTGKISEDVVINRDGVVLMLTSGPHMVQPGSFLCMIGQQDGEVVVPQAGELEHLGHNVSGGK